MKVRGRPRLAAVAASCALAAVAACTVFDGLQAEAPPGVDGGGLDSPPPPPNDNSVPPVDAPASSDAPPDSLSPPLNYLSLSDAAKVCSLLNSSSCQFLAQSIIESTAVPVDAINYSACMDWLAGPVPPDRVGFNIQQSMFQCIAGQTTCQGAGSCVSTELVAPNDPRCPIVDAGGPDAIIGSCEDDGGTVEHCEFGLLLHCYNAYYAPGSTCLLGDFDNEYWCSTARIRPCQQGNTCLGGLFEYCGADNLVEGINCPTLGYNSCGTDDAGIENCATNGVVSYCSAAGATDCVGDILQACDGFELNPYNCAALDGTCSNKGQAALCARPGDTCTPYDNTVDQCTGTSISLCIGGQPTSFDCSTIGKSCVTGGGAAHCG